MLPDIVRTGFMTKASGAPAGLRRGMFTVELDLREFEDNLDRFMVDTSITHLRRGLGKAMATLMDDIVKEEPTAPILTSALRGSMTVFVNKILHAVSKYGIPTFQQHINTEHEWRDGEEGLLVVNAPYAAIQHEAFPVKSEPGAGMYYVLKKLSMFAQKYGQIVVDELKKARI